MRRAVLGGTVSRQRVLSLNFVISRWGLLPYVMPKRRRASKAADATPAVDIESAAVDEEPPAANPKKTPKQKKTITRNRSKKNEATEVVTDQPPFDEVEWEQAALEEDENNNLGDTNLGNDFENIWQPAAGDFQPDASDHGEEKEPVWDATQKEENGDFDIDFAKGRKAKKRTPKKLPKPKRKGHKEPTNDTDAREVESEDGEDEEADEGGPSKKAKKKAAPRLTKGARAQLLALHQVHLLCGLAHLLQLHRAANASRLAARLLSLLPHALLPASETPTADVPSIRIALHCLRSAATPVVAARPSAAGWSRSHWRDRLEHALAAGRAGPKELALLFAAMCRAMGWTARVVAVLSPPPKNRAPDPLPVEADEGRVWAEVRSEPLGRWVPVDAWSDRVDDPRAFEPELPRGKAAAQGCFAYVVAADNHGRCTDVTVRYSQRYTAVALPQRVTEEPEWWPASLAAASGVLATTDELDADLTVLDESFPTSQDQYRRHPLYCLEKFVGKFEILHPKDRVLGHVSGQPIYPRSQLHKLHTLDGWLKEGREVQPGAQPIKRVAKRQRPLSKRELERRRSVGDDAAAPAAGEVELFGEWQTQPYEPPTAHDGIVPKSPFGNVYMYKAHMLPRGTVHVQLPGVARVCRFLGVDFAPALVGWELRGGQNVPVLDGVVLCQEYYGVVREAWEEHERRQADREAREVRGKALRLWRRMARALLVRARLAAAYSLNSSAAPAPAASHLHVHNFDPQTDVYSEARQTWLHRCSCGHEVPFERI